MGVASMKLLAHTPELSIRRSNHPSVRNRQRRGRSFPHSSSSSDQISQAHAEPPASIALIDPKPLTRQSLLEMLASSLPEHVTLIGASSFDELPEVEEAGELS